MPHPRLTHIAALLVVFALVAGCRPKPATTTPPPAKHPHTQLTGEDRLEARRGPRSDAVRTEPQMRIRVATDLHRALISAEGSVEVGPGQPQLGTTRHHTFQTPLIISHDKLGFVLTEPTGKSVRWRLTSLSITSPTQRVTLESTPYPGHLELVAERNDAGQFTGRFDAVNHVGMESYLPGVLSQELYAGWDEAAYRAQAVAARSYAIWEMRLPVRRNSHFDLEAGQASQAYLGDKASDKARRAVADTAGQVLTFEYRVLPAFYSSCSGGTGQDAVAAWPGKVDDLAPLRGRAHGGWGQQSTKFRWGPITRDRSALSRRIAAWGRAEKQPVARLGLLTKVEVTATNRVGRPTKVRLSDDAGQTFELYCEQLRMASNFRAAGLPTIDMSNLVYSSHAEYTITGSRVSITGRGFGHGVGMCQFGAQHMATEGYDYRRILGFYYPGAEIRKLY